MRDDIKNIIEEIYCKNNTQLFIQGCHNKIEFLEELLEFIRSQSLNVKVYPSQNEPTIEMRITVNSTSVNGFTIKYESILLVNKFINYFYLQHEFSMDNPDTDGIDPCIDGFRDEAYSKKQFVFDENIVSFMIDKGYHRLSYNEMEETFPGVKKNPSYDLPDEITVNNALFMDMWGFFD